MVDSGSLSNTEDEMRPRPPLKRTGDKLQGGEKLKIYSSSKTIKVIKPLRFREALLFV